MVYIRGGDASGGEFTIFGAEFREMGVDAFVAEHLGATVVVGAVVALHNGERISTYQSSIEGVVVQPVGLGHGWDTCLRVSRQGWLGSPRAPLTFWEA